MFSFPEFCAAAPWLCAALVFGFGACIGSFLNVVILRHPRGQSILRPRSRCDACGEPLRARDMVPLLGWLLRRGRARCCGAQISLRHPLGELLTALLFVGAWLSFAPAVALCVMAFAALLIIASGIDFDHGIIPDWLTLGGAALGLLLALLVPELHATVVPARAILSSAQGLLLGSAVLLWIALVAELLLRREAMGFGDVKLVGMIGAFTGWQGAVFAIFGGAVLGTLAVGLWRLLGWLRKGASRTAATTAGAADSALRPDSAQLSTCAPSGLAGQPCIAMPSPAELPPTSAPSASPPSDRATSFAAGEVPFGPMLAAGALAYILCARPWVARLVAEFAYLF